MTETDIMRRALNLAQRGAGYVSPNPCVGAVLVKNNRIIGEGFHEEYGKAHAEINALHNATENPAGAEMYVTLEPCNHIGKTGSCSEALVRAGISRVIIAAKDTNPDVSGGGSEYLRLNGIEVSEGLLRDEARYVNRAYYTAVEQRRPFFLLKWAMSIDGSTASHTGDSQWISSEASRAYVHQLRHESDAVLVGVETVLHDNPRLTCREIENGKNPVRVVIDSRLRTNVESFLVQTAQDIPVIFIIGPEAHPRKKQYIEAQSAECIELPLHGRYIRPEDIAHALFERGIHSVLVEGGGKTAGAFIDAHIADEVIAFCAPCIIGGESHHPVEGQGVSELSQRIRFTRQSWTAYGEDMCFRGLISYPEEL